MTCCRSSSLRIIPLYYYQYKKFVFLHGDLRTKKVGLKDERYFNIDGKWYGMVQFYYSNLGYHKLIQTISILQLSLSN